MECPKCHLVQPDSRTDCLKCGIVFEKYRAAQRHKKKEQSAFEEGPSDQSASGPGTSSGNVSLLKELLFYVNPENNVFYFGGRVIVFLVLTVWGFRFIFSSVSSNYAGESFLHLINLPFHEAGHIIFSILGRFPGVLGGSLLQLLVPVICILTFLLKTRDTFGASVCLWWTGESLMDLAPYINDARALKLILLGGVTGQDVDDYHDWEFILRKLGLLNYDHLLAYSAQALGIIAMICALAWGGFLLIKQFKTLSAGEADI